MASLFLYLLAICTFVFYGVVGQDKTWLLGPAYLISYVIIAIAVLKRAWRMAQGDELRTANFKLPTSVVLWMLFLLWGITMIPQAVVPFESKLVMLFVGTVIGAYLVWGAELRTFKDNRLMLGFLIFVVMVLALYGMVVHFRYPQQILWTERYAVYEGRLMSTYICPNHFAHLMQMLMPFCVALLFIRESGLFLRLLCAYSFAAFLPPLFLTESRAGWLGAFAAFGVVVCLMALRRSKKLFFVLLVAIPLLSMLLLLTAWRFSETFQRRAAPVVQFLQGQAEEGVGSEAKDFRPQTWMDTIDMIKEVPLVGFGPGNYRYTYPEHRKRFEGTRIVTGHPHNEYLELIADFGLIGFGLFALAWCYGIIRILIASLKAQETRHAFIGFAFLGAAAGTMVHSFFDFQMHVLPNALVFALLAVIAAGPLFAPRREKGAGHRRSGNMGDEPQRDNVRLQTASSRRDRIAQGVFGRKKGHEKHESSQKKDQPEIRNPFSDSLCSLWLNKIGAWLLAIGYLALLILSLQTMTSAFLRAMADKKAVAIGTRHVPDVMRHTRKLYKLAVGIDGSNWRAYKGMASLMYNQRYYSLDGAEKMQLAEEEAVWHEKAHIHNPKDPETAMAYGKCLLFLAKARSMEDEEISRRDNEAIGVEKLDSTTSVRSAGSARDNTFLSPDEQIGQGLDLLREACRYRPFNDVYWWNLGVELRKLGRYEEAMEVFKKAQSIRSTPTTRANITWLNARIKALDSGSLVPGTEEQVTLPERAKQPSTLNQQPSTMDFVLPDPDDAEADPDLMDLLDVMEQ